MRFAFEGLLILLLFGASLLFLGLPLFKLVRLLLPKKTDPVGEAQERLEVAKKEAEAARLNKEAEKVYSQLYAEVLEDDNNEESNRKKL